MVVLLACFELLSSCLDSTQQLLQPVQAHTTARLVHAKCNILAWNLVLVGCPLKVRSYLPLVLQKVPSEANPKVRNHGEGPY